MRTSQVILFGAALSLAALQFGYIAVSARKLWDEKDRKTTVWPGRRVDISTPGGERLEKLILVRDPETGCQYLLVEHRQGPAVAPRLAAGIFVQGYERLKNQAICAQLAQSAEEAWQHAVHLDAAVVAAETLEGRIAALGRFRSATTRVMVLLSMAGDYDCGVTSATLRARYGQGAFASADTL